MEPYLRNKAKEIEEEISEAGYVGATGSCARAWETAKLIAALESRIESLEGVSAVPFKVPPANYSHQSNEEFEATELFAAMTGKPEPETDEQISALDNECIDRFGIGLVQFTEIISHWCMTTNSRNDSN